MTSQLMAGQLLLDNSAWARLGDDSLTDERTDEIAAALEKGQVTVCLPFLLEAGYSATSAGDHSDLFDELCALPSVRIDGQTEARAIDAQCQLARAGHHRLPPVDLILSALADCNALDILHYDADFDVISAKTDLRFGSVWLAPRGTL